MKIILFILGILKVIGIILLSILSIILLLILTILFTPIKYKLNFSRFEDTFSDGEVSWLFGSIKAIFSYTSDNGLKYKIKFFTKRFDSEEDLENSEAVIEATEKKVEEKPKKEAEVKYRKPKEREVKKEPEKEKVLKESKESTPKRVSISNLEENLPKEDIKPKEEAPKKKPTKKAKKEDSIFKKINAIENKREILKAFIAFIKGIFKSVKPKDIYANMEIGLGEPSYTGYMMGAYGIGKAKYGKNVTIKPYYEDFKFQGEFRVKGKIRLVSLLYHTLKFVLKKPVFILIKNIMKGNVI